MRMQLITLILSCSQECVDTLIYNIRAINIYGKNNQI